MEGEQEIEEGGRDIAKGGVNFVEGGRDFVEGERVFVEGGRGMCASERDGNLREEAGCLWWAGAFINRSSSLSHAALRSWISYVRNLVANKLLSCSSHL